MRIDAAVAHANRPSALAQVDLDQPRANDVLLRVTAAGTCQRGTGILNYVPSLWPAVLGHEGVRGFHKLSNACSAVVQKKLWSRRVKP